MVVLTTPRLLLRHLRLADASALERVFCDAEVMRYSDGLLSPSEVQQWIREYVERWYAEWGCGMWAVVEGSSEEVLGYCGLSRFADRCQPEEAEIGYRLARAQWGRGVATEAALAVRDHAFGAIGIQRLLAIVDPGNTPSVRVAEKLGMRYDRDVMFPGYDHPDHVYILAAP
ncbi:MAG: GNAT family N-acetyltransferase [Phycisphaerales bacterium JB038]